MACPYFEPVRPADDDVWPPPRQPLGATYHGLCHASAEPAEVQDACCNTGYARYECGRFPGGPDALRFAVRSEENGELRVVFVYERDYAPERHGEVRHPGEGMDSPAATAQLKVFAFNYLKRRNAV